MRSFKCEITKHANNQVLLWLYIQQDKPKTWQIRVALLQQHSYTESEEEIRIGTQMCASQMHSTQSSKKTEAVYFQ